MIWDVSHTMESGLFITEIMDQFEYINILEEVMWAYAEEEVLVK